jgi:hypothetical protein
MESKPRFIDGLIGLYRNHPLPMWITTVVLGAIGSGVWEVVFSPIYGSIVGFLLSAMSFGVKSFKDAVYVDVSAGLHEVPSMLLLSHAWSLEAGALCAVLFYGFTSLRNSKRKVEKMREMLTGKHKTNTERELTSEEDWKKEVTELALQVQSVERAGVVVAAFLVFMMSGMMWIAIKTSYANSAIVYYKQMAAIVSPDITDDARRMYDSRFASIENGDDYSSLITELRLIADKNNRRYPKFTIW